MPSERIQRQVDSLLDEGEAAIRNSDWETVRQRSQQALTLDPESTDALALLAAAERGLASLNPGLTTGALTPAVASAPTPAPQPTSFANGRYEVKRFLGEGGKKKVYLAHDSQLDRDVAFALIKTEGLDDAGRVRIQREAQAMGRLGNHPNIVTVYDIGDENGQPYLVLPILSGGDVEGVIEKAAEHKLALDQALKIAIETCQGLELAHSKGIIHRDLKPGNVWLTEDGRAMIGDFGLAVAADRSRLTQAGMMVGTVSYMPPEQAMGGEVGPRSDLYSLGAMLYEMVCGRPPFVGDESVAIIGQHLNTPPVAPTWHRPDCPPALEALILRLLEKDPTKRPASATEVREALQSVVSIPRQATVIEAVASAANDPLYRRTFVGRENEVKQLQQAFDAAMSGNGALVMVVGEPGIGKTAICEQLATYVALRGGKALVGHCYEEGSLSLPYLAFVEAMRSYVLARAPEGLRSDLGTGAADVARIVSEVRDRVQGVELRPAGDPEDDRWRLLQSVTSFLRNASSVQPLVIVLEDLHWADRGSLDLLLHVARNLQGARVLIVGNYRDVEVDRTHPLSGVLAELRRINSFANVRLRGLTVDEVHRMYEAVRGQAVPWGQAEAVFRQTEGNPLFVQEVLRYLVEEGIVVREGGRYVAQQGEGVGIPEGLRDVVGKRLNRLGEKTNQVLSIAAVIGRDFRLDLLQRVAGLSEDDVETALQEAEERAIIESRSALGALGFRFSHAFFRQTLYEEIFASRRLRLHQQVARALEEVYARRLEEHAGELAEHFAQSTDAADLGKALHYSELAAQRAISVFDYGEAVRHLEQALKVVDVLDQDDREKRCDLLLALGEALANAGEPRRFLDEVGPKALALAESLADRERTSKACMIAMLGLMASYGGRPWNTDEALLWAEAAVRCALDGSLSSVWADAALGRVRANTGRGSEARDLVSRALQLARRLEDNDAIWFAGVMWFEAFMPPQFAAERLAVAQDLFARPRQGLAPLILRPAWVSIGNTFIEAGQRDQVDAVEAEIDEAARRTKQPNLELLAIAYEAIAGLLDGRLEKVVNLCEQLEARGEELGLAQYVAGMWQQILLRSLLYLGRRHALLERFESVDLVVSPFLRALKLVLAGEIQEAHAALNAAQFLTNEDTYSGRAMGFFEAALLTGQGELADELVALFRETEVLFASRSWFACVSRLLGDWAALRGDSQEARGHYLRAMEACGRLSARPERALSLLGLAELLLEHYPDEHDAAIEHLDFAIGELRDMKMQPALERALRHRGLLKA